MQIKKYSKKLFSPIVMIVLLCAAGIVLPAKQAEAREIQTLFHGDITHGGFGGPVIKFGSVDGDLAVWVGGRGGWIINISNEHTLSLGGGGFGLTTEHRMPVQLDPSVRELAAIGYGGFEMEYTNRTYRLIHMTASTLIGAGGITVRDDEVNISEDDPNAFFVLEPGIHAELNVTSFFRIATGLTYRLTSGIDNGGFRDRDFSGFNAQITFKFGAF